MALFASGAQAQTRSVPVAGLAIESGSNNLSAETKNQIVELVRQGHYQDALDTLDKTKSTKTWQTSAYYALLYSQLKPLVYSLPEAKLAVKLKPDNAICRTNLGILLQRNGQRAEAVEQYRKAALLDATDWRPRAGIAQCLGVDGADGKQIADRELKLAFATTQDSVSKWTTLGTTYLVLRQYKDASLSFARLLKLKGDDYKARCLYLKSLLKQSGIVSSAQIDEAIKSELADKELAELLAQLPKTSLDDAKRAELLDICQKNFGSDDLLFYNLGRAFESRDCNDLALAAYQSALKIAPQNSCYMLSIIGNRLRSGDNAGALDYIKRFAPEQHESTGGIKTVKRYKDAFAHTLALLPSVVGANQWDKLHILKAVYHHLNCGCRIPVIEFKLRNLNGVVYAGMQDQTEPPLTVIYDATLAKPDTIIDTARREDDVVEVLSDEAVKSLPSIISLIQTASDKPDKHLYTIWSFEPPPMELP